MVMEQNNQIIEMDPMILAVFNASTHVSNAKGASQHMMKPTAKRRRTKAMIEEAKQDSIRMDAEV